METKIKVITYEQERLEYFKSLMRCVQKKYDRYENLYGQSPYLSDGAIRLSDAGQELQFYKDVIAMLEKGNCRQEWISVEDRLPERAGKYLVATFDGRVGIGNLIDYYCDGDLSFDNYKVTHWMPLPEPPKKGGAE